MDHIRRGHEQICEEIRRGGGVLRPLSFLASRVTIAGPTSNTTRRVVGQWGCAGGAICEDYFSLARACEGRARTVIFRGGKLLVSYTPLANPVSPRACWQSGHGATR